MNRGLLLQSVVMVGVVSLMAVDHHERYEDLAAMCWHREVDHYAKAVQQRYQLLRSVDVAVGDIIRRHCYGNNPRHESKPDR